jgi:hypothetical protein
LDLYQVDIGADPLFSTGGTIATFTAPSNGAYNANITLGGTVSNARGQLEPNGVSPQVAFSYLNAFCTIGVSIRVGSTSGTEIANFSYYNDWSQAVSGLSFIRSTTPNPTLVGSINLTSGVTYYIVPYIAGGGMSSITTNINLDTHALQAIYKTPTITAVSIAKGISKSELVAGAYDNDEPHICTDVVGHMVVYANSGVAPYAYTLNTDGFTDAAGYYGWGANAPGVYNWSVTDATGCSQSGSYTITIPAPIMAAMPSAVKSLTPRCFAKPPFNLLSLSAFAKISEIFLKCLSFLISFFPYS